MAHHVCVCLCKPVFAVLAAGLFSPEVINHFRLSPLPNLYSLIWYLVDISGPIRHSG